ncbi:MULTISPECIES: DUF7768 domain-containing protein [Nocardia]|nr:MULTISPECIES: hypothetical protein [Nocardia]
MILVIVESPYAGDILANEAYARRALADSLARGEAPFASHLLYTQPGVLDDTDPAERAQGIAAGFAWGERAELTAVYVDRGVTPGMAQGIRAARAVGRPVTFRFLDTDRS